HLIVHYEHQQLVPLFQCMVPPKSPNYPEMSHPLPFVHSGLLSDILGKRMSGETVGPYAGDIDKLLGERTGISFGGGEPMQFITGSQQRLLSDLLGAQETALGSMQGMSENRMKTDIFPEAERYRLEREITDEARNRFTPSTAAGMSYLQNLLGMLQPMEMTRYHATPSVSGTSTATGTPSTAQTLGNIGDLFGSIPSIVSGIKGLFS
ncbi:MAG: hypothetical protein SV775_17960, partial [Thermodesulfobacteriota bacterium]|nr:hypothetical protein [Thermodesulfobacteriota bacterium]